jgi:inhibitor of KinA
MSWTRIVPLGDQAALAYFGNETAALGFAARVRRSTLAWVIDVVQAYSSVAVFFDPDCANYGAVIAALDSLDESTAGLETLSSRLHVIPCCYEHRFAPDLERVAEQRSLDVEEVIHLHSGTIYTIYAIGFCPGYPFLGYLPDALSGVPRLHSPRLKVEAGSVGLTGRQTGIYTEPRPGGWNLVGRTPLQLVAVADGYFPLRTGDRLRFEPIGIRQFEELRGQRLPTAT